METPDLKSRIRELKRNLYYGQDKSLLSYVTTSNGRFTLAFRTGKNRIAGPEMPARQKVEIVTRSGKPEFRTS